MNNKFFVLICEIMVHENGQVVLTSEEYSSLQSRLLLIDALEKAGVSLEDLQDFLSIEAVKHEKTTNFTYFVERECK